MPPCADGVRPIAEKPLPITLNTSPAVALSIIEQGYPWQKSSPTPMRLELNGTRAMVHKHILILINFPRINSNPRRKKDESLQLIYRVSA